MDRKKRRLVIALPVAVALVVVGLIIGTVLVTAAAPPAHSNSFYDNGTENYVPDEMPPPDDSAASVDCDFEDWEWQPIDEDALRSTGRPSRILPPGSSATMDYSPQRINVHTDENGIVQSVDCG